jgi:hypothetical protein
MSAAYFPCQVSLDWSCPVCVEGNKNDTVAHGVFGKSDGTKHPIHRKCMLNARKYSPLCVSCRAETDAGAFAPLLEHLFGQIATFFQNPLNQISLGTLSGVLGAIYKKRVFLSLGLALQALGLHRAIVLGGSHIPTCREIERLADALPLDDRGEGVRELTRLLEIYPQYAPLVSLLAKNGRMGRGLMDIKEIMRKELLADRIIRTWRGVAFCGSLYFGTK